MEGREIIFKGKEKLLSVIHEADELYISKIQLNKFQL